MILRHKLNLGLRLAPAVLWFGTLLPPAFPEAAADGRSFAGSAQS
jgi:hypothetical protein